MRQESRLVARLTSRFVARWTEVGVLLDLI